MKVLMALTILCVFSITAQANTQMMEIIKTQNVAGEIVESTIYADKIARIKPSVASVANKKYPYLSIEGLNGEKCRITEPVAKEYGFSLGEMAMYLQQNGIYLKCTQNYEKSFVFLIEVENRLSN